MRLRLRGGVSAALLLCACSASEEAEQSGLPALAPGAEGPPDIVLVVLDTLRADHLSCYGYPRETSPHLDALCAESTVYETVYSASSWTLPSHASLFTGLHPIRHGTHNENRSLGEGPTTLAEALGRVGYATEAIVANAMLSKERGLDRGFQVYLEGWRKAYDDHPALFPDFEFDRPLPWEEIEDPLFVAGMRQLRPGVDENAYFLFRERLAARGDAPLFLFVNLIGIHSPYNSAGPFYDRFLRHPGKTLEENRWAEHYAGRVRHDARQLEHFVDLYDAEVLHADDIVRRMIVDLKAAGRWENTLFVVTSDHGEHFGEHGHVSHVFSLHEGVTRVPLVVHYPPRFPRGARIAAPVHGVDLFPTLLAAAGAPTPAEVDGRVLPRSDEAAERRPIISEYYYPWEDLVFLHKMFGGDVAGVEGLRRRMRSIRDGDLKLIWASDGRHALYDLALDPNEEQNRIDDPAYAEQREALLTALERFVEANGGPRPVPDWTPGGADPSRALDPETLRQLEELGYL